jgi:hypothetical protein
MRRGKHGRRGGVSGQRRSVPPAAGRSHQRGAPGRGPGAPGPGRQPRPVATGSRAIFRKEALEFHARSRDLAGGVVRLGGPWLRWLYRLTIALVLAGAAGVVLIPARQSSSGPAVIDPGSGWFAALFPVAVAPELATAQGLSFALPGAGLRPLRVTGVHVTLATAASAARAGLTAPGQPSILLTGRLLAGERPGPGRRLRTGAVLVLPARPLAAVLGQELRVMLGGQGRAGT